MNRAPPREIDEPQLALGLALIWFATALGLNVGLGVVLERTGASALPALLLVNAFALAGATATVTRLGRGAPLRSLVVTLALSAALVGASMIGEASRARWSAVTLYVVASIVGDVCVALFWSHANGLFDARSAKKAVPRIGAAGTAGAALAGLVALAWGSALGTRGLVALWIASLVAAAAWTLWLHARSSPGAPGAAGPVRAQRVGSAAAPMHPADGALVRALAVGFVVMTVATYVGRYAYSWSLSRAYGSDAVAIAKLNGLLNAIASVAAALVQLFVTPFVLARWGVGATALTYPAALVVGFGALAVHPGLAAGVALFFATSVLRRAVHGPVETVLPSGLAAPDASRAVLAMTAVGTPVGMLIASAALLFGRASHATSVGLLGLGIAATLVALGPWRGRAYRGALRRRLAKGGNDLRSRLLDDLAPIREAELTLEADLRADDPALLDRLESLVRARRDRGAIGAWRAETPLAKIALARLAEAHRLHAALRRLPAPPASAAPSHDEPRWLAARALWVGAIRHRIGDDLRAVLLVLRATTGQGDLDRISRRMFDADARARSAAVEILDTLCPDDLRPLLVPLVEDVGVSAAADRASKRFGAPAADPVEDLLDVPDAWVRACTAHALHWLDAGPYRARLVALRESTDPFLREAVARALSA